MKKSSVISHQSSVIGQKTIKSEDRRPISDDKQKGFTIIEVLVAIIIIGVIGYILSDILIRSLNNGRKSQVIGNVKQNAQNALNIMSEAFRNADDIVCTDPLGSTIVMYNKNGAFTRLTYVAPVVGPPAKNGFFEEDIPTPVNAVDSATWCDLTVPAHFITNPIVLTDSSFVSGVNLIQATDGSGSPIPFFTVAPAIPDGSKRSVTIIFDANTSVGNTTSDTTLGSVVRYETTAQLR